jgi:ABC-2 type transport system permease protein
MPLFMISPALFPLELLPDWLATIAKLNPVTYTVLLVREMMTGVSEGGIPVLFSLGILLLFVFVMIGLASYVFTREVNKPF